MFQKREPTPNTVVTLTATHDGMFPIKRTAHSTADQDQQTANRHDRWLLMKVPRTTKAYRTLNSQL